MKTGAVSPTFAHFYLPRWWADFLQSHPLALEIDRDASHLNYNHNKAIDLICFQTMLLYSFIPELHGNSVI